MTAAIVFGPDMDAVMGGLGVGLAIVFIALLLSAGASIVRRFSGS